MAALIGYLEGNRNRVSRLGTERGGIRSTLETWEGSVTVSLESDGTFTVRIGSKGSEGSTVLYGNVSDGKRSVTVPDSGTLSRFGIAREVC